MVFLASLISSGERRAYTLIVDLADLGGTSFIDPLVTNLRTKHLIGEASRHYLLVSTLS